VGNVEDDVGASDIDHGGKPDLSTGSLTVTRRQRPNVAGENEANVEDDIATSDIDQVGKSDLSPDVTEEPVSALVELTGDSVHTYIDNGTNDLHASTIMFKSTKKSSIQK